MCVCEWAVKRRRADADTHVGRARRRLDLGPLVRVGGSVLGLGHVRRRHLLLQVGDDVLLEDEGTRAVRGRGREGGEGVAEAHVGGVDGGGRIAAEG